MAKETKSDWRVGREGVQRGRYEVDHRGGLRVANEAFGREDPTVDGLKYVQVHTG